MVHQGDFGGNLAHPIQATRWATSRRLFRLRPPLALRQFRPLSRPTGPARGFRGPAILVPTHWCRRPSRARLSSQPENHPHRCWTMPQAGVFCSCSRKPRWRSGVIWSRQGAEFPSMPAVVLSIGNKILNIFCSRVFFVSRKLCSIELVPAWLLSQWYMAVELPLFLLLECRVLVKLLYPFTDRCSHGIMTLVSNYTCKGPTFSMCQ